MVYDIACPDAAHPQGVDSTLSNSTVVHDQLNNHALMSKWLALLTEYANIFELPGKPVSRLVDHCINLIDPNAVPPKPQLYRMLEDKLKAIKDTIDDYLARGWIRPSTGSYGVSVIVIQKKIRELHIVIEYRLLNKLIRLDSYPVPYTDELLDHLAHAKYFSKIDLVSGYYQI